MIHTPLTHTTLKYFYTNYGDQRFFFQFKIIINVLVSSSALFEYLCYGYIGISDICILTLQGLTLDIRM